MTRPTAPAGFWKRHGAAILGAALVALAAHSVFGEHGYLAMRRMQREADELRMEIEKLNRENQSLSEEIDALKTDPKAIERIAREEMGLARPGEMIFKLPDPPEHTPETQDPQ